MSEIRLSATAGPDGVLHLNVPVGGAGDYEVVIRPRPVVNGAGRTPTPEELGWPPGFFEQTYGSITDESFVAPPRRPPEPITPLDADE